MAPCSEKTPCPEVSHACYLPGLSGSRRKCHEWVNTGGKVDTLLKNLVVQFWFFCSKLTRAADFQCSTPQINACS